MKKLLLLAAYVLPFTALNAASPNHGEELLSLKYKDSIIKKEATTDPKDAFKDLFETASSTNSYNAKLNPQAISFAQDYLKSQGSVLTKMKAWGQPYLNLMNGILEKHGLPTELVYLSVIESALKSSAISWAGAVGPWQFMPETARLMGLKVNGKVDERKDFAKSTHAAARYLTKLYGIYGDWLLVIAAYNCGPGNVNSAIRRSGSRNFWKLQNYLPAESRNHVKKFIATHYFMEGEGGVTTLTKAETEDALENQMKAVTDSTLEILPISGKYSSVIIVQYIQMGIQEFNKLNPNFDKTIAADGTYELRLPTDKALQFQANKPQIQEQSIRMMLSSAAN